MRHTKIQMLSTCSKQGPEAYTSRGAGTSWPLVAPAQRTRASTRRTEQARPEGFLHKGALPWAIFPFVFFVFNAFVVCSSLCSFVFFFFPPWFNIPTPPASFVKLSKSNAHFQETSFIFRPLTVACLQHASCSFFSHINLSETAEDWWVCDKYYSLVLLFFVDLFFFYHLFHFAANSTFVPWTNSITMTQSTTHTELSSVSSCLLKPAHGVWWVERGLIPTGGTLTKSRAQEADERAAVSLGAARVTLCAFQPKPFLCHFCNLWSLRSRFLWLCVPF